MYRIRVLLVFLSAIALALAAAGCGGDGEDGGDSASRTTPDAWAATVCGALGDWVEELQAESQSLQPAMRNTTDLASVKKAFVTFLEDAEESISETVDKVEDAGAPDLPRGEEMQNDFVAALKKVEQSLSRAVAQANELSTSNLQSFSTGVSEVGEDVQTNLGDAGKAFNSLSDRFKSTELDNATNAEPECQQFKPAPS